VRPVSRRRLPERLDKRRRAAVAGHEGDVATARELWADPDGAVRAAALGALARAGALEPALLAAALDDDTSAVRARALELAAAHPGGTLVPRLADEPSLAEAAAFALGERRPVEAGAVDALAAMAADHADALCREAAVAALGAIGDPRGLPAVLRALDDKATVRRRAVIALAPFDGPDVDAALQRAAGDRDRQVRQAAEDQLG
jgi:HEAT repeat protein